MDWTGRLKRRRWRTLKVFFISNPENPKKFPNPKDPNMNLSYFRHLITNPTSKNFRNTQMSKSIPKSHWNPKPLFTKSLWNYIVTSIINGRKGKNKLKTTLLKKHKEHKNLPKWRTSKVRFCFSFSSCSSILLLISSSISFLLLWELISGIWRPCSVQLKLQGEALFDTCKELFGEGLGNSGGCYCLETL